MDVVLPIMSVSRRVVLLTVRVMVMVKASVIASEASAMLRPSVYVMLGVTAVLNSKPVGVFRIRVTFVPAAKSPLAPSAMVTAPSEVHAGEGAVAAVSAEMLPPPMAVVMVTVASAWVNPARAKATTNSSAMRACLFEAIGMVFSDAFIPNCLQVERGAGSSRRLSRLACSRQGRTDNMEAVFIVAVSFMWLKTHDLCIEAR